MYSTCVDFFGLIIVQQWLENNSSEWRPLSPHNNSDFSSAGGSPPLVHVNPPIGSPQQATATTVQQQDDEIIPTAIVIKNIPFNVKRETLLDIIVSHASFVLFQAFPLHFPSSDFLIHSNTLRFQLSP